MLALLRALPSDNERIETIAILVLVPITVLAIFVQVPHGPITWLALGMVGLFGFFGLAPLLLQAQPGVAPQVASPSVIELQPSLAE
jgi:hypothetical protein